MSAAARQSGAQAYLQQNRIGALFEELMAGLIREQPQEPLLHLMRTLQRKAADRGLAVPASRPSTAAVGPAKSLAATSTGVGAAAGRSYDKPWLKGASSAGVRKSTSGGDFAAGAATADATAFEEHPLAPGSSKRHRQSRASLTTSSGGEAVFMWSSATAGPGGPPPLMSPAPATASEDDILGAEFRQTRGAADRGGNEGGASRGDDAAAALGRRHGATAASRQAAKQARLKQLEATLATGNGQNRAAAASSSPAGVRGEDDDNAEVDGVLLLEDADELAAEGARVSRRSRGVGRAATARRRDDAAATVDAAAAAAEPQVRMTFCGRCFALINADEAASIRGDDDAIGGVGVGGFLDDSPPTAGVRNGALDDLDDQFGPPHTGRTNATMTEVTDIESASQVTGPRRPSWSGGGGRSGTPRQRRSAQQDATTTPGSTARDGGVGARSRAMAGGVGLDVGGGGVGGGTSGGWGAAAAAAAAAEAEWSDQETERHQQQDVRLY